MNKKADIHTQTVKLNKINIEEYLLLHTLKAKINGKDVHILIDNGSTYTVIPRKLAKELQLPCESKAILDITTFNGESKNNKSDVVKMKIKNHSGEVEIKGYTVEKNLNDIDDPKLSKHDFNQIWPNLSKEIQKDIYTNQVTGPTHIVIGLDNLWKILVSPGDPIIHPSEELGIIKTKMGWTMSGIV